MAAVESAFRILNDLPPASSLEPTNYPFHSQRINYAAQTQRLNDLKSYTLFLLLEQMGLTQPTRYIYVLRGWNPSLFNYESPYGEFAVIVEGSTELGNSMDPNNNALSFIIERNFDAETLSPSFYVNGTVYGGLVNSYLAGSSGGFTTGENYIIPFAADPYADIYTAAADIPENPGEFRTGLTYDDVGGLRYLLSTNNVNDETLLPSVHPIRHGFAGRRAHAFVNGARRPGVEKITFVRQPVNALTGAFLPMTSQFIDHYFTNGILKQQPVARVVSQPDFLFLATDTGDDDINSGGLTRTGTTNWMNNATLNENTNGEGPGVIQPPIKFNFGRLGRQMFSYVGLFGFSDESAEDLSTPWSTFDGSTNPPISYPAPQTGTNRMIFRMWLSMGPSENNTYSPQNTHHRFEWSPVSQAGTPFVLQTSTNLADWVTLFSVTNNGSISSYFVNNPASVSRFYRLIPQ
ncbi:MAG: hypothetical protein WAO02_17060 [Verrucomicrobiia bacterium]